MSCLQLVYMCIRMVSVCLRAQVQSAVLRAVASYANGREILKRLVTKLLDAYERYLRLVQRAWRRPPAFCKDLMPMATLVSELRRLDLAALGGDDG